MKLKYVVCLTCLLLFVAAIDTVPDPPVINPHSSDSRSISALSVRGPSTLLEKEASLVSGRPRHIQTIWFSFRLALNNERVGGCPLPLVRHAADPSPPIFLEMSSI